MVRQDAVFQLSWLSPCDTRRCFKNYCQNSWQGMRAIHSMTSDPIHRPNTFFDGLVFDETQPVAEQFTIAAPPQQFNLIIILDG